MARTRNDIITELENSGIMDNIVSNITKSSTRKDDTIKDLKQMTYLTLLEKDEEEIIGMYERGQLLFYIARILTNNWYSNTSKYFYSYKKLLNNSIPIEDYDETMDFNDY